MGRNSAIDISRFIFAFFVVVIHVPLMGGKILLPFARCAVPFFFIVSGYYLYTTDGYLLRKKAVGSAKKWLKLWLKYTLILLSITVLLNFIDGYAMSWTEADSMDFVLSGFNRTLDIVYIKGKGYGVSVLWFLYSGGITFALFYVIRKHLNKVITGIVISMIFIIALIINYYNEQIVVVRTISVAIPFIYTGYILRKHIDVVKKIDNKYFLYGIILFTITLYIESLFKHVEIYVSTFPLTTLIFIYLVKNPELFCIRLKLPVKISMDIYLWHRLTYALIFGFLNLSILKPFAAVIIYFVVLILATCCRNKRILISFCNHILLLRYNNQNKNGKNTLD